MRSTTATRTSTDSAEATPSRPRIGLLGIMQALYDEMLPGITERQAAYARELGDALAGVADVEVGPPARDRDDIDRIVADFEGQGLDGLLVVMLTYGPGMRVARALSHTAAADLPGQRPARPRGHRRVGHGRPDLQPGHPRRAGHGQRHGPRRAPVPRHHRRLARRLVRRGGRRLGAGGRRGLALARAEGRRLRLRDERHGRHPRRRPRAAARARAPGRRARARERCTARRRPSATTTCAR